MKIFLDMRKVRLICFAVALSTAISGCAKTGNSKVGSTTPAKVAEDTSSRKESSSEPEKSGAVGNVSSEGATAAAAPKEKRKAQEEVSKKEEEAEDSPRNELQNNSRQPDGNVGETPETKQTGQTQQAAESSVKQVEQQAVPEAQKPSQQAPKTTPKPSQSTAKPSNPEAPEQSQLPELNADDYLYLMEMYEDFSKNSDQCPSATPEPETPANPGNSSSTGNETKPEKTPEPSESPTAPDASLSNGPMVIHEGINQERAKVNQEPLIYVSELQPLADLRAREITEVFEHGDCFDTIRDYGVSCSTIGENISMVSISMGDAAHVPNWVSSPGHYENLTSSEFKYTVIGVAYKGEDSYAVQIFFGERLSINGVPYGEQADGAESEAESEQTEDTESSQTETAAPEKPDDDLEAERAANEAKRLEEEKEQIRQRSEELYGGVVDFQIGSFSVGGRTWEYRVINGDGSVTYGILFGSTTTYSKSEVEAMG